MDDMRIWGNSLLSIGSASASFLTDALPYIQLLAAIVAVLSGIGAIHLALLKVRLAKKELKQNK